MSTIKVNRLPGQTWNWLGMNEAEVEDLPVEEGNEHVFSAVTEPGEKKTQRFEIVFPGGVKGETQAYHARSGSELTVFQYLDKGAGTPAGRMVLKTRVKAEKGARVKLVQLIAAGKETEVLGNVEASLDEGAYLEVDQVFLSGKRTVFETSVTMEGRKASFVSNVAYDVAKGEDLDLNLISRHVAKKTEATIDVKGVLRQQSRKLLRATIDFVTGCSGSVGKENEEVLLLDESVVNQTIPLILCGEEDVEGAHGASIGRIDEESLFYLESRGIPEEEIYKTLANARIVSVLSKIGDEQTADRVKAILGDR